MKRFVISIPYVYPACPLNLDHSRLFIIADVFARYQRSRRRKVVFPVATHYSGIAAHKLITAFKEIFSKPYSELSDKEKSLYHLYTVYYKTPEVILRNFDKPEDLLNYFSQEILWEFRSLNISCDYNCYYSTDIKDYSILIKEIVLKYQREKILVMNNKRELALDYNNKTWRRKTINQINKTNFIQPFHKNNIISATRNIRSDWGLLRNGGLGVRYQQKGIIDPMFDSELFTLFDLFIHKTRDDRLNKHRKREIFQELIISLGGKYLPRDSIVKEILADLPCDIFIGEEHLKNWIVKKIYAETLIYNKRFRTKNYFITGMGLLDGKRMSASKGHSILTKDLINTYGGNIARLAILLCGGHPSKNYNFDKSIPALSKKLIDEFTIYYQYILTLASNSLHRNIDRDLYKMLCAKIDGSIDSGYFKQGVTYLLITIPKQYRVPKTRLGLTLHAFYSKYLKIFLPGLAQNFIDK